MATSTIKTHASRLSVTEYGDTITIATQSAFTFTKNVSVSGKRIIGIVGVGAANGNALLSRCIISGNNAIITVKNDSTSEITVNLYFDVLYEAT